ncbi:MAG: hypothetical protein ABSF69_09345 [Polyangiaceae bacterium]|jgi:hypothetical protein
MVWAYQAAGFPGNFASGRAAAERIDVASEFVCTQGDGWAEPTKVRK